MTYSLDDKKRVQAELNLDSLPDDEFMELATRVTAAAVSPRGRPQRAHPLSPDALESRVAEATVGRLLTRAKEAKHCSNADIAARLGVTKQRVAEILGSSNLKFGTFVEAAAVIGYETRVSLHPVDNASADLEAVLPSAALANP
jgi:hypothetical protein